MLFHIPRVMSGVYHNHLCVTVDDIEREIKKHSIHVLYFRNSQKAQTQFFMINLKRN